MKLVIVVGVLGATVASADPATDLGDRTAARALIAETATCVPKPSRAEGSTIGLRLGFDPGPTLCAIGEGDKVPWGPLACWTVDVAKKRLVPTAPRLLPGETVRAQLAKGCTHGLCIPKSEKVPPDAEVELGLNDTGDLAAIFHKGTMYLFDRKTAAFKLAAQEMTSFSTTKIILSRDKLGTITKDAGPQATFGLEDVMPGPRQNPDGPDYEDAITSVYEGNAWLVAPGTIMRTTAGFHEVSLLEVAIGKAKTIRKRKPSKCLTWEHSHPGETSKCNSAAEVSPYLDASVIATPSGYLAVLSGSRAGELVTLSPKLVETKLFDVHCK